MTTKAKTNIPVNDQQINRIADLLASTASRVIDGAMNAKQMRDDALAAGNAAKKTQLDLICDVARAAHNGAWQVGELVRACKMVSERHAETRKNDKASKKALENFLTSVRIASAPEVRPHVDSIAKLCADAWIEEALLASDDGSETPCRTAFKRLHNMTMSAFTLCKGSTKEKITPTLLQSAEDINAWARSRDPSIDVDKITSRIESIAEELSNLSLAFPVSEIIDAATILASVKTDYMRKAQLNVQVFNFGIPTPQVAPIVSVDYDDSAEETKANDETLDDQLDNLTGFTNLKQAA